MSIRDRMSSTLNRIANNTARVNRALETTDRLTENANPAANFERTASAVNRASGQVENFNRRQQESENGTNKIKSGWSSIKGLIAAAGAAFSVRKLIELTDTMTSTRARLDLINDGLQSTDQLQEKIAASANRSRSSYVDTAAAVSKLGTLAGDAFNSNDEMIAFTELMNKNFVIGGSSIQEQSAAMYQLTQAMAAGRLQGDEFRSIMENAPLLAQSIADYMGKTTGELREMSSQGLITADVIKGAMFAAADETNAKFAQMPMTFAQVWTIAKNIMLQTFEPIITAIGHGAQWIYDNWSTIAPVFWGLAAGVLGYAVALGIQTAAQWIADGSAKAFFATLMANPLFWIALAIGVVVAAIYKWVQSVGGIKVAWLICCNAILTAWDWVKIAFMTSVYWVMNKFNQLQLCFATVSTNIQNFMGDMKAGVLMLLQNMVNGAIDIINGFINTLNKIPGVNIGLIEQVTFGTTAQLENEAAKSARASDLAAYQKKIESQIAKRDSALETMKADAKKATAERQQAIAEAKQASAEKGSGAGSGMDIGNVDSVGSVGSIDSDINIAEEDLKFLRDVAEMRYVQNFVTLTPTVAVDAKISEKVDVDEVVRKIETKLEDEFAAAAEGVYN